MSKTGRPKEWGPDSDKGKLLWSLICSCETWLDITEHYNRINGTDYAPTALSSAAYRNGWSLGNREEVKLRKDEIHEEYGVYNYGDIPVFNVDDSREWIPIWLSGDMHVGNQNFLEEAFLHHRDMALDMQAYCIGMGDWLETAVPTHMPQTMWSQSMNPDSQAEWCMRAYYDIDLIDIIPGNHEYRIINATNIDPLEQIATEKGAYYDREGHPIVIRTDGVDYFFYVGHGWRFTKNSELEVREWAELYPQADVVALGHDHSLWAKPLGEHFVALDATITTGSSNAAQVQRLARSPIGIRIGHFLGYGGYVARKPYKPKRPGNPLVWLNQSTKRIVVDTDEWTDRNR